MAGRTDYKFTLSREEIDRVSELVAETLTGLGTGKKDILRTRLGLEELMLELLDSSEGSDGLFSSYQKWGRRYLEIRVRGPEPVAKEEGAGDDGEFSEYSTRILENMGLQPETFHRKGWNYIRLTLSRQKKQNPLLRICFAIVIAVVLGIVSTTLVPQSIEILTLIVEPLVNTFLGILSTIAGIMIFLSVVWGILCIGDASTLGTLGKKIMSRFLVMTFLITAITFGVGCLCFRLNFSSSRLDYTQFSDVYQLILSIFPTNIIAPFYENNTMQIIVLAIPFGIAVLILEQKAAGVVSLTEQLNLVVQYLMGLITKLIPVFVFLSIFRMFLSGSFTELSGCWKLLLLIVAVPMANILVLIAIASGKFRVSFGALVRKLLPTFLIALTTASSSAAFSTNMDCCENQLGIHTRLTKFGLPLGMVIYMPAAATCFALVSIYMTSVYEVPVSAGWIVIGILIIAVLSIAAPPIPGGSLTCYTIMFAQLGIPAGTVALAAIIDVFADFYVTASDLTLLQLDLLLQADSLKLLDRETLKKTDAQ